MEVKCHQKLLKQVLVQSSVNEFEEYDAHNEEEIDKSSSSLDNQSIEDDDHNHLLKTVFGGSSEFESEDFCSSDHRSMDEYQKQMIEDVFGESSDSEVDKEFCSSSNSRLIYGECDVFLTPSVVNPSRHWQRIESISGLWLCSEFLSSQQQSSLLDSIDYEGLFKEGSQNQAMRFGDLPFWALELSFVIREVVLTGDQKSGTEILNPGNGACVLPSHLLSRNPFLDQLIVNVYQPGEGICAHVDLMRFEDGIAIVSLESPCVMHFSPVEKDGEVSVATKIPVYLIPGSLIIMWGEARYRWKHEINRKPGFQTWEGQEIEQRRRTSITLRKLCVSE